MMVGGKCLRLGWWGNEAVLTQDAHAMETLIDSPASTLPELLGSGA